MAVCKPIADCRDRVAKDVDVGSWGIFYSGIRKLSPILSGPCPSEAWQPRIGTNALVMEATRLHRTLQELS